MGFLIGMAVGVTLVGAVSTVAAQPRPVEGPRVSLVDAVRLALETFPSVGASQAAGDEARAVSGEAEASRLPTVTLDASLTQNQEPAPVTPIHGFTPGLTPQFDETLIQAGVSLHYRLFDGGVRSGRIRQARAQVGVADAELDATRQALAARVVSTYLDVLGRREVLDAHDHRLAALRSESSRVRQRFDAGRAARVESLRIDAALAGAEADRVRAAEALGRAERDLARLIGQPASAVEGSALEAVVLSEAATAIPLREQVEAAALRSSAVIREANGRLGAAEAAAAAARGAAWPELRLAGSYVDRGSRLGDYAAEWLAGLQLSYTLFNGGARGQAIARAEAARRGTEDLARLAALQVEQEVDHALSAVREARARVDSLEPAIARFRELARIERLLLDAGSGTQTDFLNAEADLLTAQANLVEARHAEIAARVELARVAGELNLDWLADAVGAAR
jgi:outer membrane protein TolC